MLASKSRSWPRRTSSPLALALTVSLSVQALVSGPAQALSFITAKKSQLQTPMEAKLDLDAGPISDTAPGDTQAAAKVSNSETKIDLKNDSKKSRKESKKDSAKASTLEAPNKAEPQNLAPVSLTDDKQSGENSEEGSAAGGRDDTQYMKLHAETMGVAPKGPLDGDGSSAPTTLPSKSLKSEIGPGKGRLVDQAKNVNVMPTVLMDTDEETDQKIITDRECEKAQVSDLWEATLTRNQDIQFVVQKLMPSSDKSHATTALMRMISSTLATGISAGAMLSPSPAGYMSAQMGSSMIMQSMGLFEAKNNRKAQIDQGQAISLYKMVRDTADKVTENYRDYKKYVKRADRAQTTASDLQNMIQDARAGQDAAKQIEMEYTLSKAKGDVEEAWYDARRYRQTLIDLAGSEAVNKLDQSLQDQLLAEKELDKKTQVAEKPATEPSKEILRKKDVLEKLINTVQPPPGKSPSSNM
jgi:hypothetical protein